MKHLTDEHRKALCEYRFERAHQTMEEAVYMRDSGYYIAAVNRLYYACFYAASGLLIAKGRHPQRGKDHAFKTLHQDGHHPNGTWSNI